MKQWQNLLFRRHVAYAQCFLDDKNELTPAAKIVIADLERFASMGNGPTVVSPLNRQTDVPATMQRVGRADVVRRMFKYLRLPIHKLFEIEGADAND